MSESIERVERGKAYNVCDLGKKAGYGLGGRKVGTRHWAGMQDPHFGSSLENGSDLGIHMGAWGGSGGFT